MSIKQGDRFFRLVVIRKTEIKNKENRYKWECLCDCGNKTLAYSNQLKHGQKTSCGCIRSDCQKTHGMKYHPLYSTWRGMISRCTNKKNKEWHSYGGRGINVCDRWMDINNFISDMGEKPTPAHSLDRVNNNGNYEPSNCRWATSKEQGKNKRDTIFIEYKGVSRPLVEWADIKGVKRQTMYMRYRRGYTNEEIVNGKPSKTKN